MGDRSQKLPCLSCVNCADIGKGPQFGFEDFSAPNLSNSMIDDLLSTSGFVGLMGTRVVFIDEAHALKPSATDKFLEKLEKVRSTLFIFATDRPEELAPRLTNRLKTIRLRPLELDVSIEFLKRICSGERYGFDEDALALIADISNGSARALVAHLEDVSSGEEWITADLVRRRLNLDRLRAYVTPLVALLEGDHAKSVDSLNQITSTPRAKGEALASLVIQLYENACLGLSRPGLEIAGIDREQRVYIVERIARLAAQKNISVDDVVDHLTAQFSPSPGKVDDAWLKVTLLRSKLFLHAPIKHVSKQPLRRDPGRVLKQPRKPRSVAPREYFPKAKIAQILDAASFFTQATGKFFNFRLVFLHERMNLDQKQGMQLTVSCLHQLSMRIKAWSSGQENLQYIYLHQVSGSVGFNTTVAGWMPIDMAYDVENWLDGFLQRFGGSNASRDRVKLSFHRMQDERAELRQHWRFLKSLCRNADPTMFVESERRRRPIVELLGIPKRANEPLGQVSLSHPVRVSISLPASSPPLPMLSAFRDGAWRELKTGWEKREFADRARELKKLQSAIRRISEEFEQNHKLRDSEIEALLRRIPASPHERERTWRVWRRQR